MKTTKILASAVIALASVAASSAFADSYDQEHPIFTPTPSTLTRAQVLAEVVQARQAGTLLTAANEKEYPFVAAAGTPKTRAEVRAELIQAEKDGSIPVYHG